MYDLEGVLGPSVMQFVEGHIRSLLTWDILVFFHKNPDAEVDAADLAVRLGRRPEEIGPEIAELCTHNILDCNGGAVRYSPDPETAETIGAFVDACQDRNRRLALIALVLHKLSPQSQ